MDQSAGIKAKRSTKLEDRIDKKEYKAFTRNFSFFHLQYEQFRSKYPNEYVAIYDSQVIDHDKNAETLMKRLKEKWEDLGAFVIEYVSPSPVELIL